MKDYVILRPAADNVAAYRIEGTSMIIIVAKGHTANLCRGLEIRPIHNEIAPPIYQVTQDNCGAIGSEEYDIAEFFSYPGVDYVYFETAQGTIRLDIQEPRVEHTPATLAAAHSNDNQAVGYAPNSTDINKAISSAVKQLRAKFPGNISAKMVDAGFVAAGSPIGIAFFYVVMERQS
ncbi:hypothetical protein [Endothiovibrio diazotrophicus]